MKVRLRTQLTVSFVATALICVVLIGVLSNLQLEKHFKEYVRQNQEKKNREIIGLITAKAARDGAWDRQAIEDIGLYAMEQGLIGKSGDTVMFLGLGAGMTWGAVIYRFP